MSACRKCGGEVPEGGRFCPWCGKDQELGRSARKRGNGQGTVLSMPNGKYKAVVVTGYHTDPDGKLRRSTRTKTCERKKDAVAAIPMLYAAPKKQKVVTFAELYELWLPTHRAGKSTMDCYKAAYKHFAPVHDMSVGEIGVDDLQECLDECPHGRRTKENMRALVGLMYKYGIPRKLGLADNLNLANYLIIDGGSAARREAFTDVEIEKINKACGIVPHAEDIYCMIYLGFRPSEFLALKAEDYDRTRNCLVGGAKTVAGINRLVTISPKIERYVREAAEAGGPLWKDAKGRPWSLKDFTETVFYPVLDAVGIDNPMVEIGGGKLRHRLTPHSCRHTFATLMKRVPGAMKDKRELIGHASDEMLMYYEDSTLADKRKITDII